MSPDMMANITGLDAARFERARRAAEEQVRQAVPMPDRASYTAGTFSKYPPAVTWSALIALTIVALAMFWISAGKAIVAADLTLGPMVDEYKRLSPVWLDVALVLFLLAGEVGTVIFSAGRALFRLATGNDRRWLTLAALACAAGALLANVSVTALHPESIAGLPVFGWFMAIMPPAIVLAVGLFIENLLIGALEGWSENRAAFNAALEAWKAAKNAPAEHPDFNKFWYLAIFDQLQRVSSTNRSRIAAAVEVDPNIRLELVRRELRRHEWAEVASALPEMPRIERVEHKALNAPVQPDGMPENGTSLNTLNSPALQRAITWLEGQPEAPSSVREAARAAGVSVGTMHTALLKRGDRG